MKSVDFSTYSQIDCGCNTGVVLCVDPSFMKDGLTYVYATMQFMDAVLNPSTGCYLYQYSFTYDECYLLDIDVPLLECAITGVICDGCLVSFIEGMYAKTILDFVPYTGAVKTVNLGVQSLVAGAIGVGVNPPDAYVSLKAGTAAMPPIKFRKGVPLTSPANGSEEYDGADLFITNDDALRKAFVKSSDVLLLSSNLTGTLNETVMHTVLTGVNDLVLGRVFRLTACGRLTVANAPDTITVRVKLGAVTLATIVVTPGIVTNDAYKFEFLGTVTVAGVAGRIMTEASLINDAGAALVQVYNSGVAIAVDTTVEDTFTLTMELSDVASAISVNQAFMETLR